MMKVLVGGLHHESDTFNPIVTKEKDVKILRGNELLNHRSEDSVSGIIETLINNNIECEDDLHSFYLNLEKSKNYEEIKLCEDIMKRNKTLYDNIEKLEKEVIIR